MSDDPVALGRLIGVAMAGDGEAAARRWAASGAMALTGPADGAADVGPARVALAMDALAADVASTSGRIGVRVEVDGAALLGERAAIAALARRGPISCGGATRLLPTADGSVVALSLARDDDRALLPALRALVAESLLPALIDRRAEAATHERDGDGIAPGVDARRGPGAATGHGSDAWPEDGGAACGAGEGTDAGRDEEGWIEAAALAQSATARAFVAAAVELGLPVARLGEADVGRPLVDFDATSSSPRSSLPRSSGRGGWTVVDLSSLWAGPLCADILGRAGARVVKVESTGRPDGARGGPPAFFDLLHGGHESVALDLTTDAGRADLRRLLAHADVVIEASRPRALAGMGASYADLVAGGWRGVWLSITGHGRTGPAAERIAFGDDAAVAGGLVGGLAGDGGGLGAEPRRAGDAGPRAIVHSHGVTFCADAVADPATGLVAAAAALRALAAGRSGLIAVSLATTAAHLAAGVDGNPAVARTTDALVAAPRSRPIHAAAAALGQHNDRWLR